MFLYTESTALYVTQFFMNFLNLAFIYEKHNTLRNVVFSHTKSLTLRKKQDNFRCVFIYKNMDTLRYATFMEFLKLSDWGKHFYMQKKFTLHYIFISKI